MKVRWVTSFIRFIYSPYCVGCEEPSEMQFLCPECWKNSDPIDPVDRCRHCFEELGEKGDLCLQCRKGAILPIQRAYLFDPESPLLLLGMDNFMGWAAFALLQWVRLDWMIPGAIVPMPDPISIGVASQIAQMMDFPLVRALSRALEYREDRLEEGQIILLLDGGNPISSLQKATLSLFRTFPKKIYLLSLSSEPYL